MMEIFLFLFPTKTETSFSLICLEINDQFT